jgi:peptidoglycan/xylan/chitin deacetylase (PgdA/CDA1 family)
MRPFAVRPDDLALHLDLISDSGRLALTVSELIELLDHGVQPMPETVLITFDDGFEDNLTVAAPLLAARRLPATVFLTTGFLRDRRGRAPVNSPGRMLDWSRLGELDSSAIEVGSHAHTHRPLDTLSRREATRESRQSKDLLEAALGHPVLSFAYPHGYGSRWVQHEVRQSGFRAACGVRNAFSHIEDNRWLLARLTVRATTTGDEVAQWLRGSGASPATSGEHLQTKVWRAVRRARALGSTLAPAAGANSDR